MIVKKTWKYDPHFLVKKVKQVKMCSYALQINIFTNKNRSTTLVKGNSVKNKKKWGYLLYNVKNTCHFSELYAVHDVIFICGKTTFTRGTRERHHFTWTVILRFVSDRNVCFFLFIYFSHLSSTVKLCEVPCWGHTEWTRRKMWFIQASAKVSVPHQIVITYSLMENNQLSLSWSEKHNALGISWPPATNNRGELSDSHGQSARWTGGAVIESWHAPRSMTQNQVARTLFFHWTDAGNTRETMAMLLHPVGS